MNSKTTILSIAAAAAMMLAVAPSALRAESAAPSGNASDFLNSVNCPESSQSPCFNPNASGTKYSGTLAVVYDKDSTNNSCDGVPFIRNVFVNVTLGQGNSNVIATTDYRNGVRFHATGFCFGAEDIEQAYTIMDLIRLKMMPALNCTAGSCNFKVKSITNFQYTAGPLSDSFSGGFSADIVIAVQ